VCLWLILIIIHMRFPSLRDVALARQVSKLTNQRIRFNVNPEPLNPEPMNGYCGIHLTTEKRMNAVWSWYLRRLPQTFGHDVPDE
jgi:hypothetical protein